MTLLLDCGYLIHYGANNCLVPCHYCSMYTSKENVIFENTQLIAVINHFILYIVIYIKSKQPTTKMKGITK